MISHFFTRPRAERGRLRQTSSSRECASLAGRAFLCTREFQRNFLVHKKAAAGNAPLMCSCGCFAIISDHRLQTGEW